MTAAASPSSALANRYAAALLDLAQDKAERIESDLRDLAAMIENSAELSLLIRSPLAGRANQEKALAALAEKAQFDTLTKKFLGVLAQNRRLNALPEIIRAFHHALARRRGEMNVRVQTATALSPAQEKALAQQISKSVGAEVALETSVNPEILGGMILTIGSKMIDDSVVRKLERLRSAMNRPSNQNATTVSRQAKEA